VFVTRAVHCVRARVGHGRRCALNTWPTLRSCGGKTGNGLLRLNAWRTVWCRSLVIVCDTTLIPSAKPPVSRGTLDTRFTAVSRRTARTLDDIDGNRHRRRCYGDDSHHGDCNDNRARTGDGRIKSGSLGTHRASAL